MLLLKYHFLIGFYKGVVEIFSGGLEVTKSAAKSHQ